MLIGVQDVAVVLEDEVGNAGDNSFAIRTADQENGGVFYDGQTFMSARIFCALTKVRREVRPPLPQVRPIRRSVPSGSL
jgi:hypothetical protein